MLKNWKKMAKNIKKYAKFGAVKILHDIPFNPKYVQKPICEPERRLLGF